MLDFNGIHSNDSTNSEVVLDLKGYKVSESTINSHSSVNSSHQERLTPMDSGLNVLSIYCAHMATKWSHVLDSQPIQGNDMSVEVYYDRFYNWKKKLDAVDYIGGEESYIDDFFYGLKRELAVRVWDYKWKPHTLSDAFRRAEIEENMMKNDADKVFVKMTEPVLEEDLLGIEITKTAHYIEDELDEKLMLFPFDSDEYLYVRNDYLSSFPYIVEKSSGDKGSNCVSGLLTNTSKIFDPGTLALFKKEDYECQLNALESQLPCINTVLFQVVSSHQNDDNMLVVMRNNAKLMFDETTLAFQTNVIDGQLMEPYTRGINSNHITLFDPGADGMSNPEFKHCDELQEAEDVGNENSDEIMVHIEEDSGKEVSPTTNDKVVDELPLPTFIEKSGYKAIESCDDTDSLQNFLAEALKFDKSSKPELTGDGIVIIAPVGLRFKEVEDLFASKGREVVPNSNKILIYPLYDKSGNVMFLMDNTVMFYIDPGGIMGSLAPKKVENQFGVVEEQSSWMRMGCSKIVTSVDLQEDVYGGATSRHKYELLLPARARENNINELTSAELCVTDPCSRGSSLHHGYATKRSLEPRKEKHVYGAISSALHECALPEISLKLLKLRRQTSGYLLFDAMPELIVVEHTQNKEGLNSCEYSVVCLPNALGYKAILIASLELDVYLCVDAMLMIIFDPGGGNFSHNRAGPYEAVILLFLCYVCVYEDCFPKAERHRLRMHFALGIMVYTSQESSHYHLGDDDGINLAYFDSHKYFLVNASCTKALKQWFENQSENGNSLALRTWNLREELSLSCCRLSANMGRYIDYSIEFEVPGAQRFIFGHATYIWSFFLRGAIAIYLPSYVLSALSLVLVIVQPEVFFILVWDPGLCAILVHILGDKDVAERVGKDMVLMDTTLVIRGYDREVHIRYLDMMDIVSCCFLNECVVTYANCKHVMLQVEQCAQGLDTVPLLNEKDRDMGLVYYMQRALTLLHTLSLSCKLGGSAFISQLWRILYGILASFCSIFDSPP